MPRLNNSSYSSCSAAASRSDSSRTDSYVNNQPEVDPSTLIPLKTIGKGCFGKVILARSGEELVAVKVIPKTAVQSPSMMEKVRAEVRIMKSVAATSPFLCSCRGAYQAEAVLMLTMNYASAGDLLFHLQLEGSFEESRVRVIMMQIILGLQHLHERGIVHRDLKLENILVTNEGRVQIGDFGLSKFLPKLAAKKHVKSIDSTFSSSKSHLVPIETSRSWFPSGPAFFRSTRPVSEDIWGKARTICGTPAYRAPEMIKGKAYGMEVDYWAVGCMTYECLTGWSAFRGKTLQAFNTSILNDRPKFHDLPRPVSTTARKFVLALLSKDPVKRLGYGVEGVWKIRSHPFFLVDKTSVLGSVTWQQVQHLEIPPVVLLAQNGAVANPEQAKCFPEDFVKMDIQEDIPAPVNPFIVDGFYCIPNYWVFDKFIRRPTSTTTTSTPSTGSATQVPPCIF